MSNLRPRTVALPDGIQLSIAETGFFAGRPLILIPGLSDSWRSFEPLARHLPRSVRTIAVTQRGHGDSSKPAGPYGIDVFTRDLADLLDALEIRRAVIVGHSMGSLVARRFAIEHPERTEGLLLLGSFLDLAAKPAIQELGVAIRTLEDPVDPTFARELQASTISQPVPSEFFETVVAESLKLPAAVWRALYDGLIADDHEPRLGEIRAPCSVLWGYRDPYSTIEEQRALARTIPTATLTTFVDLNHAPHWESPELIATIISDFFGQLEALAA